MKKEKGTKERDLKFNPSDYDYLDDLTVEGLIWEFIKRSKKYRDFYRKWEIQQKRISEVGWEAGKDTALFDEYLSNYYPYAIVNADEENLYSRDPLLHYDRMSKLTPVKTTNMKYALATNRIGESCVIPHPPIKRKAKNQQRVCYTVEYPPVVGDYPDNYFRLYHPIEVLFTHQGQENLVMTLIDISSPGSIDSLLEELKARLIKWRKALKLPKARSPKVGKKRRNVLIRDAKIWKSYLMVYDLITAGYSPEEASEVLSGMVYDLIPPDQEASEKDPNDLYSGSKNIENHFKKAKTLINSGYKKFI